MTKTLHIVLITLLFSFSLIGQDPDNQSSESNGVVGVVSDDETGDPLVGAIVAVLSSESDNSIQKIQGTVTTVDGSYKLLLSPGMHTLTFSYVGYEIQNVNINVLKNEMTEFDLKLKQVTTLLETTTITGSRHQKSIARSPVSISVIKPDLIANTNAVRMNSVLDKIPGVQLIDNQANIRGGSGWSYGAGSRVLLLIDDIPALQGDAGRPSWGDIPVENISQVEVLKGASSTLYGSSAMNGIINIRTGYATSEPETKASLSYISYLSPADENKKWWDTAPNRINASLLHKQKFGDLDLVLNGFYENYDSYYQDAYENRFRLSSNAKYKISDRISLGLNMMYNKGENQNPFLWENGGPGAYNALPGSLIETESTRYYIDPQLTIYDNHDNRHRISARHYSITNGNSGNQSNASKSNYLEYQYLKKFTDFGLDLTAGVASYFVSSNSELFGDVELTSNNISTYLEGDKTIGDRLTINGGLRYEYNYQESPEEFKGDTIPGGLVTESKLIARIGLNYKLDTATYVRASWGQGYRFPTITERFIETDISGFFVFPNVFLQSENGWTSEVGVKQGFRIGNWEGYADVALFWSQYDNMTEFSFRMQDGKQGFQSQNVGSTDIKGAEINIVGRSEFLGVPINILGGYTYIVPKYRDFDENEAVLTSISIPIGETEKRNFLKYRNRHNFKIDMEAFINKFSLGTSVNYTSETETIDQLLNNIGLIGFYREANPDGFIKVDARVAYRYNNLIVSVLAENITNSEYTLRPGLLEAPRNIGMRLDYKL